MYDTKHGHGRMVYSDGSLYEVCGFFLIFFIAFPCRDSGGLTVTMETGHSFMHQGLFMRDCGLMATLKVCHFSLSLSLSLLSFSVIPSFSLSF